MFRIGCLDRITLIRLYTRNRTQWLFNKQWLRTCAKRDFPWQISIDWISETLHLYQVSTRVEVWLGHMCSSALLICEHNLPVPVLGSACGIICAAWVQWPCLGATSHPWQWCVLLSFLAEQQNHHYNIEMSTTKLCRIAELYSLCKTAWFSKDAVGFYCPPRRRNTRWSVDSFWM